MKHKSLTIISVLMSIAIIGVSAISYQVLQSETTSLTQKTDIGNLEKSQMRGLGELYLLDYGNEISVDAARSMDGFTKAVIPSVAMENVVLQSIRTRDYAESQMLTAFYVPPTTTLQDLDTFESVMNDNGIIVIFTEEKQSSTYNSQKWQEDFVKAAPQVRKSDTINGYPAIVITGNPDQGIKSEVLVYKDNLQIDLVSVKHNVDNLITFAQLITKG